MLELRKVTPDLYLHQHYDAPMVFALLQRFIFYYSEVRG